MAASSSTKVKPNRRQRRHFDQTHSIFCSLCEVKHIRIDRLKKGGSGWYVTNNGKMVCPACSPKALYDDLTAEKIGEEV